MPAAARPIGEIHRTHEAMATMTTHPNNCSRQNRDGAIVRHALSYPSIARTLLCAVEATYAVAELSAE